MGTKYTRLIKQLSANFRLKGRNQSACRLKIHLLQLTPSLFQMYSQSYRPLVVRMMIFLLLIGSPIVMFYFMNEYRYVYEGLRSTGMFLKEYRYVYEGVQVFL